MADLDIHQFHQSPIPVQVITDPFLEQHKVSLAVLRCDLIHPEISGNKWFKLKYNLLAARSAGHKTILSFGGVWSNHIHALAAAGKYFGFKTIGVIRGEISGGGSKEQEQLLTPCLQDAEQNGMTLHPISRAQYKDKSNALFLQGLKELYGDFFLVPEGGANALGVKGCGELISATCWQDFDQICLACGTAATLTGLLTESIVADKKAALLGFQVLKGEGYLQAEVNRLAEDLNLNINAQWSMHDCYHFGGYARSTEKLATFMADFTRLSGVPLEPVYSGKLLYGIYDQIKAGAFPAHSKILAVHGGGLQGLRGNT